MATLEWRFDEVERIKFDWPNKKKKRQWKTNKMIGSSMNDK
jgi:hypothetical protein